MEQIGELLFKNQSKNNNHKNHKFKQYLKIQDMVQIKESIIQEIKINKLLLKITILIIQLLGEKILKNKLHKYNRKVLKLSHKLSNQDMVQTEEM